MIIRGTRFNVVRPTRLTPAQGGAFAAPVGSPVPPNDADRGVEPHHPTPARVEREEARTAMTPATVPQGFGLGVVPERPRERDGRATYENTRGHFYDLGPSVILPETPRSLCSHRGAVWCKSPSTRRNSHGVDFCEEHWPPHVERRARLRSAHAGEPEDSIIRLAVTCERQSGSLVYDRLDLFARPVVCPPLLQSEDRATAVSPETGYAPDEITEFFMRNGPRKLRNLLITECDPRTLEGLRVVIRRATPRGEAAVLTIYARSYQTPQEFQMNRVNIPSGATIDGFTCISIISPKTDEGHSYKLSAFFE